MSWHDPRIRTSEWKRMIWNCHIDIYRFQALDLASIPLCYRFHTQYFWLPLGKEIARLWQLFKSPNLSLQAPTYTSYERIITSISVQHHRCRYHLIHDTDVIMGPMASQITSLAIAYSTVYSGADKKNPSKLHLTGLCAGNSPGTSSWKLFGNCIYIIDIFFVFITFTTMIHTPPSFAKLLRQNNKVITDLNSLTPGCLSGILA